VTGRPGARRPAGDQPEGSGRRIMQRTTRVDFHCHSNISDGYFSPEALASKLAEAGVHYAALTDHDSVAGLKRFADAAARRSMVAIPGVELTATLDGVQLHLLAYGFDPGSAAIRTVLGRVMPAQDVIAGVHEAGGKVFLAHPLHGGLGPDALGGPLGILKAAGLDGIEAYYRPYPTEAQEALAALADKHGLLTSGGSDFHGSTAVGFGEPGTEMPVRAWQALREALDGVSGNGRNGGAGHSSRAVRTGSREPDWRWFALRIVLPSALVILSFVTLLFAVLIPTLEESLLARKREMTGELTNSAWSILAEYEKEVGEGRLTRAEAQASAIERIKYLRYGAEGKDYFWITDMHPRMVMHPYRPDLDGQDLSGFTDQNGVRLFVEFVNVARDRDHGYVNYVWQWKDDPDRLAAKQSYVRAFAPWGWVIGTGIYVEDVQDEIEAITGRVIDLSLIITFLAGMLLLTVTHQSLRVERRRSAAERELLVSHEKYRTLVESASEGTLMLLEQRCTYANRTLLDLLDYRAESFALLDIHDILADGELARSVTATLAAVLAGKDAPVRFEAVLRRRDGSSVDVLMAATRVSFGGREALIVNIHDMAGHKAIAEELGASRAQYRALAENINIGVFRAQLEGRAAFVELNPAGCRILGVDPGIAPAGGLRDVLADADAGEQFFSRLHAEGSVRDMILQVCKADGGYATISFTAVVALGDAGQALFCDGIMEDISERRRNEAERESLISQLQTSLLFLNEPVRNSRLQLLSCAMDTSVAEAATLMAQHDYSAITITAAGGETIGIVTDHDLRKRVVAAGLDPRTPVFTIMSSPVVSIADSAPIYEAFLLMREKNTRHLAVRDSGDRIIGIVRNKEIVRLDRYSPVVLTREIQGAETLSDLVRCHERLAPLVGSLVDSGALPHNICRIVTAVSDAVAQRVLAMALEELGPAPARFAFVALGSEGREEQTLATDQDNAIIYEDPPAAQAAEVAAYFRRLGEQVCAALDRVGYAYCRGDVMACNPQWNQPLSVWKQAFSGWILEPAETELLKFSIFFDFRCIHGDTALTRELRRHVHAVLSDQQPFFLHLAMNTLHYRPPIGLFGQIRTGSAGASPHTFDVKGAMLPIVDFARLYALQHRIEETNTLDRLNQLRARGVLREDNQRGLHQAYGYLMQMRFKHQVALQRDGRQPDNAVNPKSLTSIEAGMLKQTFSQISMIQKKVSFDFRGAA
jgi:PAS domain S-box-containing protein